jgi:lipid A 3-O-deacylase
LFSIGLNWLPFDHALQQQFFRDLGGDAEELPEIGRPMLDTCDYFKTCLALSVYLLPGGLSAGSAASFDHGPILAVSLENDFWNGTDRWYTHGARIGYLHGDNQLPRWTGRLFGAVPTLGFSMQAERLGGEVGQSIFTPENTDEPELLTDDRPYAGWLYGGLIYQRRGLGWGGYVTLEQFQLQAGVIGPGSYAGQTQTWYHRRAPRGWRHQLKNEPGLVLRYGRSWLMPIPAAENRYFDFIPQGGVSLGNIDTSFRAGGQFRLGWNLPDDFGVQTIDSVVVTEGGSSPSQTGRRWGAYLFSGIEGRAQIYTAFLDGNLFRSSHSVNKEPLVGEWRSGLVFFLDRMELAYTHIFRTAEFVRQEKTHVFGSLMLKYNF